MKVHYNGEDKAADLSSFLRSMQGHDLNSYAYALLNNFNVEINRHRFIVSYDAQKSSAKAIRFYASYRNNEESRLRNADKNNNDNANNSPLEARASSAIPSTPSKNGAEKRQEELLHKATSGIKDAAATVVEILTEFEGNNNAQYVLTAAIAKSPVDKNSKFLFFYHASPAQSSKFEMAVAATAQVPQLSEMNFMRSEKEDPAMQIAAEAMWGENAQSGAKISIKAKLEQSEQRKQYIANHPQAEQCRKQMEQRDYALNACRNVTARSNALDEYSLTIKYEKIPQKLMNATYQLYRIARYAGFAYNSENVVAVSNQADQLKVRVNIAEDHKSVNVSIEAPHANSQFNNLPLSNMAKHILIQNAQYDVDQRVGYAAFNGQYNPVCVADGSSGQTFDNKTYPLNLEKDSWYVLMTSAPKQRKDNRVDYKTQRQENVTILVKQSGENKKELKIVLNNGEHVIDMQ
ncbi:vitellogenin-2-like, partial [Diaphorina citri]|uniref:Vitellogenin-2-like n=1 Tax=Diaphorina citri TaxID=121845 RepID=A0A3Q0J6A6_DIACI